MTSIIIAALGVASWLALGFFIRWRRALAALDRMVFERDTAKQRGDLALYDLARLTPLAEIGLRRVKAVEKYEKKHRGVTK